MFCFFKKKHVGDELSSLLKYFTDNKSEFNGIIIKYHRPIHYSVSKSWDVFLLHEKDSVPFCHFDSKDGITYYINDIDIRNKVYETMNDFLFHQNEINEALQKAVIQCWKNTYIK